MVFIPIAAGDPFAGTQFPGFVSNLLLQLDQRFRLPKIDIAAGMATEMDVRVHESGQHGTAAEVDGSRGLVAVAQFVATYGQNASVFDGDRLPDRKRAVHGDDPAVE